MKADRDKASQLRQESAKHFEAGEKTHSFWTRVAENHQGYRKLDEAVVLEAKDHVDKLMGLRE
jgi:hypothetical protein